MKKIIVFGSVNMDLSIQTSHVPQKGETIEGFDFVQNPGGKGGNQAVAAAKLGAEVLLIAKVGNDLFGEAVLYTMQGYGVDCSFVSQDGSSTGIAMIIRSEGDNRIICCYGANHEIGVSDVEKAINKEAKAGDLFLSQLECNAYDVFESLRLAKNKGLTTIFNPAPAKVIPKDLYPFLDFIVVNQTECAILTGIFPNGIKSGVSALRIFQERGVAYPIVTLGMGGSLCLVGGELLAVPSLCVPNVDTTTAGDAYIGALANRLALGESIENAMYFATKAAAVTITRIGAQQSIPNLTELDNFTTTEVNAMDETC